jgi:ubiquinone/menaquinone biosynthesis C-methylase UbiE
VDRARVRSREEGLQDRLIFLRQRAEDLDFTSGYFDLVYSVKVLDETRYTEALREMYRVLKNVDGRLILVDWAKGTKTWIFKRYFILDELEKMVEKSASSRLNQYKERILSTFTRVN